MNDVTHVEIPVTDLVKAKQFYSKILNFKINTELLPGYGLVNDKNVSIGFPLVDEVTSTDRGIYFNVINIENILQLVQQNGGSITSQKNLISEDIGFGAKFKDCFGNILGLFSPEK
ncbi:MAG: VOC family protein [Candidatus Heimdallarchaeota archaeon]|nr:VOC family protein [Candidatus Heimdallarchaeota archaeon]